MDSLEIDFQPPEPVVCEEGEHLQEGRGATFKSVSLWLICWWANVNSVPLTQPLVRTSELSFWFVTHSRLSDSESSKKSKTGIFGSESI